MPWLAIGEFLLKLFTGEVWGAWQAHKLREAQNVQNDVAAKPDATVSDELSKWTKQ